ncbi:peptidoglycan/xylan/chitin deacetylase (PgdA/CDA1 family) [Scopulibacillus daqui]|uniref:Peptidoglycan/xylan/chitin deacetylase (PgdA/CDA1 family) n=1 Tax=Scopulibacillus daqui TaxID=1469162 RepID=A0ABS2PX91_9BACL|nr:polysaccharide deacetylase family protein [Scopulibacillus daqui]MBM7644652.1 peptidoglycan/xylan/chitin deacetylase (PgdA/CDA1 family) [Scopulibacillus daqui]
MSILLILLIFLCIFVVYSIIPTIVMRLFPIGIFKSSSIKNKAALTFDDGPNPIYTPRLLDLLKKHDIKATFFVVGENAKAYPDIISRMYLEGHTIGTHHYRHLSNWLLTPREVKEQCRMAADTVESITGKRPVYYRPPWGHLNLFVKWSSQPFKIIMWSAILGDWRCKLGKDKLKKRLHKSLHDGAVIVLHDSGENIGADQLAPEMMLQALEEFLLEKEDKIEFVPIDDLYEHETAKKRR